MGRLNCFTCCCQARKTPAPANKEVAFDVLKNYQTGIYALLVIQLLVVSLWIALTYVNGFSLYVVDPSVLVSSGWAHSVSHMGLWFLLEYWVGWIGSRITQFDMEKTKDKSVEGSVRRLVIYMIVLVISMIADIIHIVLTGLEIGDAESVLYVENWGFLIAFLVGYILYLVFVKGWLLYRTVVYYRALQEYYGLKLILAFLPLSSSSEGGGGRDLESTGTPLLDTIRQKRSLSKK